MAHQLRITDLFILLNETFCVCLNVCAYISNVDSSDPSYTSGEHAAATKGRKRKAADEGFSLFSPHYRDILKFVMSLRCEPIL